MCGTWESFYFQFPGGRLLDRSCMLRSCQLLSSIYFEEFREHVGACSETDSSHVERAASHIPWLSSLQKCRFSAG